MNLTAAIRALGGVAATHELYALGFTRAGLRSAVLDGVIIRVRQGWFGMPDMDAVVKQAARVGGPVTCVTALRAQGFWTMEKEEIHLRVEPTDSRLRTRRDMRKRLADEPDRRIRVHWETSASGARLIVPPLEALVSMLGCRPVLEVAASADSLLHRHPNLIGTWRAMVRARAPHLLADLSWLDGVCESGTETTFYSKMRTTPCGVRRQVSIGGVGRVDFLFGKRLIVEVDGASYHTDPERFEADRRRDAALSALGYRVLRFSYRQVFQRWPEVQRAVFAAIACGDHV